MATAINVVGVQYKDGTSLDGITISGTTYLFKNYNGITIGGITYRFTTWKETDTDEEDGNIYIEDLDDEISKTRTTIFGAIVSVAISEDFYYIANDGGTTMNFIAIATDNSRVDVSVEHCICVLMSIYKLIVAEQYEAFNEAYFQDKLDEAEYAGDEETIETIKNILLVNQAIAKYYVDVANGDREPAYTLQEYLDVLLSYAAEIDEGIDAHLDVIQVNLDTGECEEPEIDFSSMELVDAETFEVAFTDVDNLLANGDNSYSLDNYKAYLVPNGLAEFHKQSVLDDEQTGDCFIYTPTQLNVSETLKGFDWELNALYFVINDLNATIYIIQVTEDMIVDNLLTISVPCTGIGSFYSVPYD